MIVTPEDQPLAVFDHSFLKASQSLTRILDRLFALQHHIFS